MTQTTYILPDSEQHWLDLRANNINSTEVSALFGCSPYQTEFELWHAKKNKTVLEFEDTDRTKWGRRLQDAIAYGVAEDMSWQVKPFKEYAMTNTRMGSSFDFKIINSHRPDIGIMEIKNIDSLMFRDGWQIDGDFIEAPTHIEIQMQHQLEITGYNWGVIVPLVGGNKPYIIERIRDIEFGAMIKDKVQKFWASVDAGIEPTFNPEKDLEILKKIYSSAKGEPKILNGDFRIKELCQQYKAGGELEKEAKLLKDSAKAELLTIIGDAPKVFCDEFTISAAEINRKGYVVADSTYRDFRINQKNK